MDKRTRLAVATSLALALLVLTAPVLLTRAARVDPARRTRIGAFYYPWFPGHNWQAGYVGQKLVPPVRPALGQYDAGDPGTAEKQIAWCSRYGIDFLALSWWPDDETIHQRIRAGFLRARNLGDIRFCLLYESQDLGFIAGQGALPFDDERTGKLLANFDTMADEFFSHPSYLRLRGRPVVILYITRTYTEGYAVALKKLRDHMAARGTELYLIGDEIFWNVKGPTAAEDRTAPLTERVKLFDAITSYNLYEGAFPQHKGYAAYNTFFQDAVALYSTYRETAGGEVDFIPQVFPGYNDRAARPRIDHFVVPRAFAPDEPEGSLFEAYLERVGIPFLDPEVRTLLVTSWNEWNEGTQIEPSEEAAPTTRDVSPSGEEFTQGYAYSGYGDRYLKILCDRFFAIRGRVTDAGERGAPVPGATVWAMKDASVLASASTDSRGYYVLARDNLPPGRYRIVVRHGWLGPSASREVDVPQSNRCVRADLSV